MRPIDAKHAADSGGDNSWHPFLVVPDVVDRGSPVHEGFVRLVS
jgi:hypothetical protein